MTHGRSVFRSTISEGIAAEAQFARSLLFCFLGRCKLIFSAINVSPHLPKCKKNFVGGLGFSRDSLVASAVPLLELPSSGGFDAK